MWSMWNAPSDRDYYDQCGAYCDEDEPEICEDCGARWDRACEEWCETNRPASEPVPASCLAVEEQEGNFEEAGTDEVPRLGDVSCGVAGRSSQSDRGAAPWILCGPDVTDREFEELWPGLERLLNNTGRPWDALEVRTHDNGSGG